MTRPTTFLIIASLCTLAGCSGRPAVTETQTAPRPASTAPPTPTASPTAAAAPAASPSAVTATVLETMDASNYTYVRVKFGSRELWAASSQFKVAVGDTVTLSLEQPMENFHSQALNRDFPVIYFVSHIGREGEVPTPPMAVGHASGQTAATSAPPHTVTTVMEPLKDGTTVAAVWKTRKALAGKTVTLRGKVVKYNGGILGVNWIHVQDGTGTEADGSNDITVTSEAGTKVGEVITVTGVVAVDKDLGSGYRYPVIIEHASIARP